jgi:CheY-like chemotaxis protein
LKADIRSIAYLILDQHMPEMTGLELAERLRTDGSDIPVLLITGLQSPAIIARAAELCIKRVRAKPRADEDMLDFINATRPENIGFHHDWAQPAQTGIACHNDDAANEDESMGQASDVGIAGIYEL